MPLTIERNDLAAVDADAIVVAANEDLQVTGGVGAAVAEAAGFADMQAACDAIGHCPCGSAVSTPGFALRAKTVVHAVGPMWHGGARGEVDALRSAYDAALDCAVQAGARSVAVPLISAGTYGFPASVSLAVAREAIRAFLNEHDIDVRLVLFSREAVAAGIESYLDIAEYIDDHYAEARFDRAAERTRMHGAAGAPPAASAAPNEAPRGPRGLRILDRLGSAVDRAQERFAGAPSDAVEDAVSEDAAMGAAAAKGAGSNSLEDLLASLDAPFSTTLLALIDERGLSDSQVYKRANMSRQHFSKIRSDEAYRPTKKTVLALSIALELDLDETRDLLARAGFALSKSSKADVIVEYFIERNNFDIFEINEALYAFDQPIL